MLQYNYRQLQTRAAVWRFAAARFSRLWPLHFTTFVLAVLLIPDVRAAIFTQAGLIEAGFNLLLLHALVPVLAYQFSYNDVSWSISAEFYFYTCFIGLIWLVNRPFSRLFWLALAGPVVMLAISMALALQPYDPDPMAVSLATTIYIHPVARLLDFGFGMIAASLFLRRGAWFAAMAPRRATAFEAAAVLLVIATAGLTYGFYHRLWHGAPPALLLWFERSGSAPVYALAIFVLAFERGTVSRWLRHPALVLFGEISFATYLVHHIIQRWLAYNPWAFSALPSSAAYVLYLLAVLLASWVLWRCIEVPMRARLYRRLTADTPRPAGSAPAAHADAAL